MKNLTMFFFFFTFLLVVFNVKNISISNKANSDVFNSLSTISRIPDDKSHKSGYNNKLENLQNIKEFHNTFYRLDKSALSAKELNKNKQFNTEKNSTLKIFPIEQEIEEDMNCNVVNCLQCGESDETLMKKRLYKIKSRKIEKHHLSIDSNITLNSNSTNSTVDEKVIKSESKEPTKKKTNLICKKCRIGFVLHNNKCFDYEKLKHFLDFLRKGLQYDQLKIFNTLSEKMLNSNQSNKPFSVSNFADFKSLIENLKDNTVRECQKKINTFIVNFEENLQSLLEISNLIESKNEVQIRSIGYKILNQLENINQTILDKDVARNEKIEMLKNLFSDLTEVVEGSFKKIEEKINRYEELSMRKIINLQNSFRVKINYFNNQN